MAEVINMMIPQKFTEDIERVMFGGELRAQSQRLD